VSPYRPDLVECWIFRVPPAGEPEFLLIRRAPDRIFPGLWQCVTGGLEPGERIPMAALREVREEVGFGPAEIEAFFDLDQVTHFYDEGPDAIIAGAISARVRSDAEPAFRTSTTLPLGGEARIVSSSTDLGGPWSDRRRRLPI
jgi:8-oxo-dGTP pyrophosphatase MutT (NUDIX family)